MSAGSKQPVDPAAVSKAARIVREELRRQGADIRPPPARAAGAWSREQAEAALRAYQAQHPRVAASDTAFLNEILDSAPEGIDELLDVIWRELRNGFDEFKQGVATGAIYAGLKLGLMPMDHAELWLRRMMTSCPGHDDEGGRGWCAFCGNLPPTAEESDGTARLD